MGAAATGDGSGGSRVVFEFDPVVPGYVLEYIQPPVKEDASGKEIPVKGSALLQVRMNNAAGARIAGDKAVPTYTGPKVVAPLGTGGIVTELVDAGDFEGQLTWVIGLTRTPSGVRVSTVSGPSRLVIDVPGPA
ncbi:MAG TPA: hypothetical protein VFJ85_09715 [Acidimicrobiales bacterium]|nr:hypothetical protein [Acidimicrobiales bacterium]